MARPCDLLHAHGLLLPLYRCHGLHQRRAITAGRKHLGSLAHVRKRDGQAVLVPTRIFKSACSLPQFCQPRMLAWSASQWVVWWTAVDPWASNPPQVSGSVWRQWWICRCIQDRPATSMPMASTAATTVAVSAVMTQVTLWHALAWCCQIRRMCCHRSWTPWHPALTRLSMCEMPA